MSPKKIGIFDSGVGGLSVLKSILYSKYFESIIYYGDTARVPYGPRSKEVITKYSIEALDFFKEHEIELLIVACNTVSAHALEEMRKIARYPIVGVIEPGVMSLKEKITNKDSKILIIGTNATIQSNIYSQLLFNDGYKNIDSIATGLFVPIVEEGIFSGEILDSTIRYYFKDTKSPDAIILGCTHFPLISSKISEFFNNKPTLIHSGDSIVKYIESIYTLTKYDLTNIQYYASDNTAKLINTANIWLNQ